MQDEIEDDFDNLRGETEKIAEGRLQVIGSRESLVQSGRQN